MSFSESVIIPLSLFKACQLEIQQDKSPAMDILDDKQLPSSKKMLLYNQMKLTAPLNTKQVTPQINPSSEKYKEDILLSIAEKYRPYMSSILDIIHDHSEILTIDNSSFEVSIRGRKIEESNAIDIFKDLTKNGVVTKDSDIAPGTFQVYNVLIGDLKIPKSWIPLKLQTIRKSTRQQRNRIGSDIDINQGGEWIDY